MFQCQAVFEVQPMFPSRRWNFQALRYFMNGNLIACVSWHRHSGPPHIQLDVGISQSITDLLVGFILKRLRGMSGGFQENHAEIFCRYGWNLSSVSRFVRKISLAQFGFLLPAGIWNARRRWHWSLGCAARDASEFINIYNLI